MHGLLWIFNFFSVPTMPKREFGKRCFSYNGALHWNNLPHEAKIAGSLTQLKLFQIDIKVTSHDERAFYNVY
jgi:hypothetical protein